MALYHGAGCLDCDAFESRLLSGRPLHDDEVALGGFFCDICIQQFLTP